MKKFIVSLITLALLAFVAAAQAQTRYAAQTLTVPTVYTDGAISNDVAVVLDVRYQPDVAIQFRTAASNVVYRFSSSVDNLYWKTNQFTIGIVNEAAGYHVEVTNLVVKGIGYLRLDSIALTGTIGATNTVKYAVKRY